MEKRPSSYHHGDLRRALVEAALAADSLESISLRQLAAGVGVTAAAVYRHFENKEALLCSLAGIGFDRLANAFAGVFPIAEPPADAEAATLRLIGLGTAYLEFAEAEPPLWRLMFGRLAGSFRRAGGSAAGAISYDYLPAALLGLHRTGVLPRPPDDCDILFAWSVIHGAAALREGALPLAQRPSGVLARAMARRIVGGLLVLAAAGEGGA